MRVENMELDKVYFYNDEKEDKIALQFVISKDYDIHQGTTMTLMRVSVAFGNLHTEQKTYVLKNGIGSNNLIEVADRNKRKIMSKFLRLVCQL